MMRSFWSIFSIDLNRNDKIQKLTTFKQFDGVEEHVCIVASNHVDRIASSYDSMGIRSEIISSFVFKI